MTDRALREPADLDGLAFDEAGLVPVVSQDFRSGLVLMVAWADRTALERSLITGEMHFWSRSRCQLWRKGETSGNVLEVRSLHADCDGDAVLALVVPRGPACHTGETTCFGEGAPSRGDDVLDELQRVIRARARDLPEGSYTTRLLTDENVRLKKLGEETAELILAATRGAPERVAEEGADLVYHLLVALQAAGASWSDVRDELARRRR
jgi:phosphoribosyl-ATP pyrophosphohydrolase/phosphoribosyl-AMP cyclohydrolase